MESAPFPTFLQHFLKLHPAAEQIKGAAHRHMHSVPAEAF